MIIEFNMDDEIVENIPETFSEPDGKQKKREKLLPRLEKHDDKGSNRNRDNHNLGRSGFYAGLSGDFRIALPGHKVVV